MEVDLEVSHGLDDGDQALNGVVVHHRDVRGALVVAEASLMDDSGRRGVTIRGCD